MAFLVDTGLLSIPHCSLSLSLSLSLYLYVSLSLWQTIFLSRQGSPTADLGLWDGERKKTTQRRCKSPVCLPLSQLTLRSGPSAEANKEQHTNTQSLVSEWTSKKKNIFFELVSFPFANRLATERWSNGPPHPRFVRQWSRSRCILLEFPIRSYE